MCYYLVNNIKQSGITVLLLLSYCNFFLGIIIIIVNCLLITTSRELSVFLKQTIQLTERCFRDEAALVIPSVSLVQLELLCSVHDQTENSQLVHSFPAHSLILGARFSSVSFIPKVSIRVLQEHEHVCLPSLSACHSSAYANQNNQYHNAKNKLPVNK